ncbi:YslB family protein [Bacillus sp. SCS-151]|uniref:YslB family protein n=1 Tax=Nanhaiella sioensis TaxID=3115293 RepID=UPI00397D5636
MKDLIYTEEHTEENNTSVPAFGLEIYREHVLPNIFRKELSFIMYLSGKDLARKFPCNNIDEIISFFHEAGWGNLSTVKETKNELHLELNGHLVEKRLSSDNITFQLEAGFLAEQIQGQKQMITEAYEQQKPRSKKVIFTVKWDRLDTISS